LNNTRPPGGIHERRTEKPAAFLRMSRAGHPDIFEQPAKKDFFNNLQTVAQPAHMICAPHC
jgi:hypothetical protein